MGGQPPFMPAWPPSHKSGFPCPPRQPPPLPTTPPSRTLPAQVPCPECILRVSSPPLPLFVVSGLKARTICDAGPGELDRDPGEICAAPPSPVGSRPSAQQAQCPAPLESLGLFVLPGSLWGGDFRCPTFLTSWPGHPASSSPSPQTPPDLEGLLSHGWSVAAMGEGVKLSQACLWGDLGPGSHP